LRYKSTTLGRKKEDKQLWCLTNKPPPSAPKRSGLAEEGKKGGKQMRKQYIQNFHLEEKEEKKDMASSFLFLSPEGSTRGRT